MSAFVLNALFLAEALHYPRGSVAQLGPGLYPLLVGAIALISSAGAFLAERHRRYESDTDRPRGTGGQRIVAVGVGTSGYVILLPLLASSTGRNRAYAPRPPRHGIAPVTRQAVARGGHWGGLALSVCRLARRAPTVGTLGSLGAAVVSALDGLLYGFRVALGPANVLAALGGALLGTLVGLLPGIGPIGAMALLLPITFGLRPETALIMLAGIFYGSMYGGSTTSILVNVPGEAASVVTTIDGTRWRARDARVPRWPSRQ